MNMDTSSDETLTSNLMGGRRRSGGSNSGSSSNGSESNSNDTTRSATIRRQDESSPFVSMIQDGNLPVLILEKIANFLSSMEVLYLSNTCQTLQQKLQNEWQGWECEYCKRPIFMVVAALTSTTGSSSTQTTDDSNNKDEEDVETFVPPKVGGCHQCLGRRTCPECTERCIECGITACEEGHHSFDGQMCVNVVCADDFQESIQPRRPSSLFSQMFLLQQQSMSSSQQQQRGPQQRQPPAPPPILPFPQSMQVKGGDHPIVHNDNNDNYTPQAAAAAADVAAAGSSKQDPILHPRHQCRGCLNKCRTCEDTYCTKCSDIAFCKYCGNSECGYCQDQCFEEYYDE